jgi:hypothetical protein
MLGERSRHLSCFGEVAGPEARRLDKLAWSRRCAMLMESACPWKLEHVCVTFGKWSRCLDDTTEPLDRQSDRPCAYHCPGCSWKKEVRAATTAAALLIAIGSPVQSPASLALEHISKVTVCPLNRTWNGIEMIDPTPTCPKKASGRYFA